ncbi:SUMF1/EgtB/PvdO family nonheme iron enzyme [Nodosilinea sp. E11]|uniref:SUMF1/EgtB/PvdO family nonheme iron enzyme n=1 Tax=Nodosilinea sp. E11 TaxID=3037479 RepID=UPI002934F6CE|nr:SUMF1/EgtB/PvdO family nonheme iron enzyme [Nodosilinea sp. E11]WOD39079.1 SUMF1/EgtB/PvdO family nonheme iron enzyme [Nodosilinea sp. E11]
MTRAKSIFISYRRSTSIDITGRIYDRLVAHFSENSVFKDVDSIPFGVNFRNHLEQEVSHCPVLLAIIDPHWLAVSDNRGRAKLANPADWVRIEIETALQRDRLVIPVLVGGATLPEESALPEGLKALAYRQSAQVRCDPDFHRDLDRLIHRIEGVFSSLGAGSPAPSFAPPAPVSLIDELAAALATAKHQTQPPQPPQPPQPQGMGRRRWLRLMGLGLVGGGSALAVHQRVPALQTLTAGSMPPMPDLAPLPDRLQTALGQPEQSTATPGDEDPEPAAPAPPIYTYESISIDEFGLEVSHVKFSTPAYQELQLPGPSGPVPLPLVSIVGGQFVLGAPVTELGHDPVHPAQTIAAVESFWMSVYPITQAQWRAVAGLPAIALDLDPNPAHFTGDDLPVEQVTWPEAVEFCERLRRLANSQLAPWPASQPERAHLRRFRLPTETEWEYACRAKTTTPFHTGQTLTTDLANYNGTEPYRQEPVGQFRGGTTAVGSFGKANDFGLYDMHGNVLEWCAATEPDQTPWRAVRGGAWQSPPEHCRSAYRAGFKADTRSNQIGFRIVADVS